MSDAKQKAVALLMDVKNRLCAVGRHACPGYDCATCDQSRNLDDLDSALAIIQAELSPRPPRGATT